MELVSPYGKRGHADLCIAHIDDRRIQAMLQEYTGVARDEQHAAAFIESPECKNVFRVAFAPCDVARQQQVQLAALINAYYYRVAMSSPSWVTIYRARR